MDIYEIWSQALKSTEIIRPRVQALMTFKDTPVPYIILSESSINPGDTAVRRGEVVVEKPAVFLPPHAPQFQGFEFSNHGKLAEDYVMNFLFVRGVTLPSLRYNNQTYTVDVYEGSLAKAVPFYQNQLQEKENVHTGLIVGPEECWQFSLLIYVCTQIARNAEMDLRRILEQYRKTGEK